MVKDMKYNLFDNQSAGEVFLDWPKYVLHVLCCCPLSLMIVKHLRLLVRLKKTFVDVTFSSVNCEPFSLLFVHFTTVVKIFMIYIFIYIYIL